MGHDRPERIRMSVCLELEAFIHMQNKKKCTQKREPLDKYANEINLSEDLIHCIDSKYMTNVIRQTV